jgi:hypothetical protein
MFIRKLRTSWQGHKVSGWVITAIFLCVLPAQAQWSTQDLDLDPGLESDLTLPSSLLHPIVTLIFGANPASLVSGAGRRRRLKRSSTTRRRELLSQTVGRSLLVSDQQHETAHF